MNKIFIFIFVVFVSTTALAERIPNKLGVDWRTDKPTGKNWIKVTDIHYLNKSSVKKVKNTIYQAKLSNELKLPNGNTIWNYFDVRVDCKSRQAYSKDSSSKWMGPMDPTDYDNAVLKHVCK
jgi:hypothetical protein